MSKIDLPDDGKCPECGNATLTLARDMTQYSPWDRSSGEGDPSPLLEPIEEGDPLGTVRLFCADCGVYFNAPKEIV